MFSGHPVRTPGVKQQPELQNTMLPKYTILFLLLILASTAHTQVNFLDHSFSANINNNGSNHGVSFGDYNNDGWEDIYVAIREDGPPNKLYKNLGDGTFVEVSNDAGVGTTKRSTAAIWGDINNDSHLDLYIGNSPQPNQLYINNGDGTFTDITTSAMVGDAGDARSVQFADIDNDGYLDIYVHNFSSENVLYKNNGDLTFDDITTESGATDIGPAMGTIFFDFDNDGDQDLYLTNDGSVNVLYANDGNGVFEDVSSSAGLDISCSCMGVDLGDYNLDGFFDVYITNYGINYLFENNGDGTFSDIGNAMSVDDVGVGWGTFWFDYNNDGYQDIYMVNNSIFNSMPNILYKNNNGVSFSQVSQNSIIEGPHTSFGSASADINNDGSVDFFIANWGQSASNQLFLNEGYGNNSIEVKAIGTLSNHSAIGAVVKIKTGGKIQMDQVTSGASYAGQNSLVLHFGVGSNQIVDELHIRWPSGVEESYTDLPINHLFTLTEQTGIQSNPFGTVVSTAQLMDNSLSLEQNYPNPFSQETIFSITLDQKQTIELAVYSLDGRKVRTLKYEEMIPGNYQIVWDGTDIRGNKMNSGLYYYTLRSPDSGSVITKKLYLD